MDGYKRHGEYFLGIRAKGRKSPISDPWCKKVFGRIEAALPGKNKTELTDLVQGNISIPMQCGQRNSITCVLKDNSQRCNWHLEPSEDRAFPQQIGVKTKCYRELAKTSLLRTVNQWISLRELEE
ncbi:hypothetical protein chiPu_0009289 [Chiloscyllium punctatum]|uniref:Uncharacterized protein n=1 Tax=Chiloscyllium punctatum TaxID=137246 RepID=A0A401SKC8_CHIPU|nr:hypothetical protein [Chiloscyllium punctatum]